MSDQSKQEPIQLSDDSARPERTEIDISQLPALPPPGSKVWGRSRGGGRARWLGCGCGVIILIAAIVTAYLSLRKQVWSSYEEVRGGLERSILVEVEPQEKQRFLDNLGRFETVISAGDDPYPSIGRFVRAGRQALADFSVDSDEVEELNRLLEETMAEASGTPSP